MQDGAERTSGQAFIVREVGGRRIFKAQRFSSGNWLLVEVNNTSRRTINHEDFMSKYEKVPPL